MLFQLMDCQTVVFSRSPWPAKLPLQACVVWLSMCELVQLLYFDLGMLLGSEVYCMDFSDLSYSLHMPLYSLYEDER